MDLTGSGPAERLSSGTGPERGGKEGKACSVGFSGASLMWGHLHPPWKASQAVLSHSLCSYSSSSQAEAPKLHFFLAPTDATCPFSAHCSSSFLQQLQSLVSASKMHDNDHEQCSGPSLISARDLQTSAVTIKQFTWKVWLVGGVGWFRAFLWSVPAPQFLPYLYKAWDILHLLKKVDSYLEPKDTYFIKRL